jgi:hypothetical protein
LDASTICGPAGVGAEVFVTVAVGDGIGMNVAVAVSVADGPEVVVDAANSAGVEVAGCAQPVSRIASKSISRVLVFIIAVIPACQNFSAGW